MDRDSIRSGPENYEAAVDELDTIFESWEDSPTLSDRIAIAQVHATLALVAATVRTYNEDDLREWTRVTAAKPKEVSP